MGLREYEANVVFARRPDNFIVFDTGNVIYIINRNEND